MIFSNYVGTLLAFYNLDSNSNEFNETILNDGSWNFTQ